VDIPKGLKVGSYWHKYTDKQKTEFITMAAKGTSKNDIRSFLTACSKHFDTDYTVVKCGTVESNGAKYAYADSSKTWYPLG
jgi:hypothetical protein